MIEEFSQNVPHFVNNSINNRFNNIPPYGILNNPLNGYMNNPISNDSHPFQYFNNQIDKNFFPNFFLNGNENIKNRFPTDRINSDSLINMNYYEKNTKNNPELYISENNTDSINPHNLNDLNLSRLKSQHFLKNNHFFNNALNNITNFPQNHPPFIGNSNFINNEEDMNRDNIFNDINKPIIHRPSSITNPQIQINENCPSSFYLNQNSESMNSQNRIQNKNLKNINLCNKSLTYNNNNIHHNDENLNQNYSFPTNNCNSNNLNNLTNININNYKINQNHIGNNQLANNLNLYANDQRLNGVENCNENICKNKLQNIIDKNIFLKEFVEHKNLIMYNISNNNCNITAGTEYFDKDFNQINSECKKIPLTSEINSVESQTKGIPIVIDNSNKKTHSKKFRKIQNANNEGKEHQFFEIIQNKPNRFVNKVSQECMNKFENENLTSYEDNKVINLDVKNISGDLNIHGSNISDNKILTFTKKISTVEALTDGKNMIHNNYQVTIIKGFNYDKHEKSDSLNIDKELFNDLCEKINLNEDKNQDEKGRHCDKEILNNPSTKVLDNPSTKIVNKNKENSNPSSLKNNDLNINFPIKRNYEFVNNKNSNNIFPNFDNIEALNPLKNLKGFIDYNLVDNSIVKNTNHINSKHNENITSDYYAYKFTSTGESLKLDWNLDKELFSSTRQNKQKIQLFRQIDEEDFKLNIEKNYKILEENEKKHSIEFIKGGAGSGSHLNISKSSNLNESFDKEFNDSYGPKKSNLIYPFYLILCFQFF